MHRQTLAQRREDATIIDQKIFQQLQQVHQRQNKQGELENGRPDGLVSNVAAIEPYLQTNRPKDSTVSEFSMSKQDPKYQSMPMHISRLPNGSNGRTTYGKIREALMRPNGSGMNGGAKKGSDGDCLKDRDDSNTVKPLAQSDDFSKF